MSEHPLPPSRRAVITGLGVCAPLGLDSDRFADAVVAGEDRIRPVTTFDTRWFASGIASGFDGGGRFNGVRERDRSWIDPAVWYALHALDEALRRSGLAIRRHPAPERVSVAVGSSHSGLVRTEDIARAVLEGRLESEDPRRIAANLVSHIGTVVATRVGALGERLTVSSACASSNNALGLAFDLIRGDRADVVVTGGSDTISLTVLAGFNSLRALSEHKTAPFSTPVGINVGEGAGMMVVESLEHALARGAEPIAEILGYGLSGDAHHITAPDTEGRGAEQAMREALRTAGLPPDAIDYVSAHGTGTDANDGAEATATLRVFGDRIPVSSSKSFLGHTLGASGVMEAITTLLLARRGLIPHTANFAGRREGCPALDYVPNAPAPGTVNTFICNNFGFGGNNASVVLTRSVAPELRAQQAEDAPVLTAAGVVSGCGDGFGAFADALWSGRTAVAHSAEHRGHVALCGALPFRDPELRQFARSSPMIKFAIKAAAEAIGDTRPLVADNPQAGLIVGIQSSAQRSTEKYMESIFAQNPGLASAHHFPMTTLNATGGQVSILFRLKGYTTTLAGGVPALQYAMDLVRTGRQELVLAGASDELTPLLLDLYRHAGVVEDGPAPCFAAQPRGFNFGEAGVMLRLEGPGPAARRGARPLARVAGFAHTQDAHGHTVRRDGRGLARAIRLALLRAGIGPEAVDAVVAFGTGPAAAAEAERNALASVFGDRMPPHSSVAGTVGYAPAALPFLSVAAGAAALARASLFPCSTAERRPGLVTGAPLDLPGLERLLVVGTDATDVHMAAVLTR